MFCLCPQFHAMQVSGLSSSECHYHPCLYFLTRLEALVNCSREAINLRLHLLPSQVNSRLSSCCYPIPFRPMRGIGEVIAITWIFNCQLRRSWSTVAMGGGRRWACCVSICKGHRLCKAAIVIMFGIAILPFGWGSVAITKLIYGLCRENTCRDHNSPSLLRKQSLEKHVCYQQNLAHNANELPK